VASPNDKPQLRPISRIPANCFVARNPRFAPAKTPPSQLDITNLRKAHRLLLVLVLVLVFEISNLKFEIAAGICASA
jgi:hypothetical protein